MNIKVLSKYRMLEERYICIAEQLEGKYKLHDAVIGNSGAPAFNRVTNPVVSEYDREG